MLDKLRMTEWLGVSLVLLTILYFISPQQLPLFVYKEALLTLNAFLGYWLWRRLFTRGGREADQTPEQLNQMMLARAVFVGAVILAGALAL